MRSVLLCVGGESTEVGKSPISPVLLTLLLQPQHRQESLGTTRLTQVVISAEREPRLAGGVKWSRRVLIPLGVLFCLAR